MTELIWKGKHRASNEHLVSKYHLHTTESFERRANANQPETKSPHVDDWRNRLIIGDKTVVLPALLHEFAKRVDLIYIDPPFMTGRNFASYSDRWGNDLDAYLQWLYEAFIALHQLLANDGSLYVHLDWRTTHYA